MERHPQSSSGVPEPGVGLGVGLGAGGVGAGGVGAGGLGVGLGVGFGVTLVGEGVVILEAVGEGVASAPSSPSGGHAAEQKAE